MSYAIRCRGLVKHYPARPEPVKAVNGLNLEVHRGECFGLLGPNGAGKTTTIEILEGLLPPSAGDVEVLGERWATAARSLRQRLGITLQETRLADKLTVREVATLFRSFYDRGVEPMIVLEKVGLVEKQDAYVSKLSGGQRQRLAIACALVGEPELLFLDEPTTGLDPQSRRQLWDIIRDLKSQGRTILLTTHYMDEAEKLCDRVAIVDHGQVISLGTPTELITRVGGEHLVEFAVEGASALPLEELQTLPGAVRAAKVLDDYQIAVTAVHKTLPALLEWLQLRNISLANLTTRHASLEDVFVTLTGRHLRDEA
ncbi:MAG: ABC transporter ATP-binding protein [Planctomycetota bacterium]|jgi:ABC-2 type transport system ATP-binding protein